MKAVVTFSAVDWEGLWQRPHSLMSRLAHRWPVVFGNNTGIRSVGWTDLPHMWRKLEAVVGARSRLVSAGGGVPGGAGAPTPKPPNLSVLPLLALPLHGSDAVAGINRHIVQSQVQHHLRSRGLTPGVLWVNLPSPGLVRLAQAFDGPVVYDCADEFASFPRVPPLVAKAEGDLLRRADLVITSAHSLAERRAGLARRLVVVPNGVAPEVLEAGRACQQTERTKAGNLIVGYVGALHDWFDVEAVRMAASAHPEWIFRLIGPANEKVIAALSPLGNVRLEGKVPSVLLPEFLRTFDVGIIPFRINHLTQGVNPLKLYEYLAFAIPVVSSELPEVRRLDGVASFYREPSDLAAAIEQAVSCDSPEARHYRRQFAGQFSWEALATQVENLLESWMEVTS